MNEHDKTKTFNHGKGLKITWSNAAIILAITTLIGGFLIAGGRILESFDNHEREMAKMQSEIKINRQWQIDWPATGKLALDGVQNEKIAENKSNISENRKMIRDLEKH